MEDNSEISGDSRLVPINEERHPGCADLQEAAPHFASRERELKTTKEEVRRFLRENAILRREQSLLLDEWNEAQSSLGWILVRRAHNIRARLFREHTIRGRCWSLFARFLRTAGNSGIRVAVRKSLAKIARHIGARLGSKNGRSASPFARFLPRDLPVNRFQELPWRFLGTDPRRPALHRGHFKLLLVGHSAGRTGAPLFLLRVAEELSQLADVDCWIVLKQGGELAESFARIAPTLEVETLIRQGVHRDRVPELIAASFHEFSSRGVAVCNTLAVSEFHAAFAARNVAVLSWIHELPTFIDSLGGRPAIERIKAASHRIMVPAEAVRTALVSRFGIDPDRVRTAYFGQDARTRGLSRETARRTVLQELELPEDARIVLGCGTVDLRKGADLFVNLARRVLTDPLAASFARSTYFIWVGHLNDDDLQRWVLHDAGIGELERQIRFIGTVADTAPYFLAADLFALTSREDPCPQVNLEAMEAGLAVVAFLGAGGAPEVLRDCGICVGYIDVDAMAQTVRELLTDPELRGDLGRRGQTLIREQFTRTRFMDQVRDLLASEFGYRASQGLKVSVIIPNYRHARFLEERLRSVFDQTLRPHEIIFLDDASPDESIAIARSMAPLAPAPFQIVVNDQNSGSTFRQWIKGLSLATGDLVWIAESDDSAHPRLLERIVPEFYDPEVTLAYCQSALVGPRGEKWADNFLAHTDDISTTRWRSRYCVPGTLEAELALSQKNTIPNASAVVFRRPEQLDFTEELFKLRFGGDWFFYAMLLRTGKIAYLPEVLNFYRRHEDTVTHRSVREDTQAQESLHVKALIFETFPVTVSAIATSLARTALEYNELSERMNLKRPAVSANPHLTGPLDRIRASFDRSLHTPSALKILLVAGDLKASGESTAIISLASALAREYTVLLCNSRPEDTDSETVARLDDRVILLEGTLGAMPWSPSAGQSEQVTGRRADIIKELIRLHHIDVIHSGSWLADRLVLSIIDDLDVPWVIHSSGALGALERLEEADPAIDQLATTILSAAAGIFYEHKTDFTRLEARAIRVPSGKPRWLIHRGSTIDQIAATCAGAYTEVSSLLNFQRDRESTKAIAQDRQTGASRSSAEERRSA
jgi:glycosyltransferase involved in cell wall biosynthesis